jgi:hypothetical protein
MTPSQFSDSILAAERVYSILISGGVDETNRRIHRARINGHADVQKSAQGRISRGGVESHA